RRQARWRVSRALRDPRQNGSRGYRAALGPEEPGRRVGRGRCRRRGAARPFSATRLAGGRSAGRHAQQLGPGVPVDMSQCGLKASDWKPIEEGMSYRLTFLKGTDSFEVQNFYYSHTTYEEVFREAGFDSVRWHRPAISHAGVQQYGRDYWQDF